MSEGGGHVRRLQRRRYEESGATAAARGQREPREGEHGVGRRPGRPPVGAGSAAISAPREKAASPQRLLLPFSGLRRPEEEFSGACTECFFF